MIGRARFSPLSRVESLILLRHSSHAVYYERGIYPRDVVKEREKAIKNDNQYRNESSGR